MRRAFLILLLLSVGGMVLGQTILPTFRSTDQVRWNTGDIPKGWHSAGWSVTVSYMGKVGTKTYYGGNRCFSGNGVSIGKGLYNGVKESYRFAKTFDNPNENEPVMMVRRQYLLNVAWTNGWITHPVTVASGWSPFIPIDPDKAPPP